MFLRKDNTPSSPPPTYTLTLPSRRGTTPNLDNGRGGGGGKALFTHNACPLPISQFHCLVKPGAASAALYTHQVQVLSVSPMRLLLSRIYPVPSMHKQQY